MANVCCSIELEPRTLNEGQLNHAREVAADVVQKMEPKEASIVVIKGLPPPVPAIEMDWREKNGDDLEHNLVSYEDKAAIIEGPCQCSCIPSNVESPEQVNFKEPLSAPF
ncbi:hypothetical protein Tsubulata_034963 [Turnera subulata]|uniref:Uncharacterized protein n=1 Tax=Turnera subulata TaxID=218843 RepID=A0A9Q0FDB8_9ROSI|nr:hypothetical protein Tsubulata_034963 [Turnera subulata]